MFSEIQRVLKSGGKYICITEGAPEERMNYFSNLFGKNTKVETHTLEKEHKHEFSPHNKYYVYTVLKPNE